MFPHHQLEAARLVLAEPQYPPQMILAIALSTLTEMKLRIIRQESVTIRSCKRSSPIFRDAQEHLKTISPDNRETTRTESAINRKLCRYFKAISIRQRDRLRTVKMRVSQSTSRPNK
jgi:hypothetical protein